jgi:DNA-binding transcriptional LysR family regulator
MTFVQLQVLVAVVETSSFTAAAERLGMTQSAVSHALAGLEAALGVPLVDRQWRGVALTAIGETVVSHARAILSETEHIRQSCAAIRGLAEGKVRIGSLASVSARLLPQILRGFRQNYPQIELVVFEGTDQEVWEWIRTRAVDIGFVTMPNDGVETVPLLQDEMCVVVADQQPLARHQRIPVAQLGEEPFILSRSGCGPLIRAIFRDARVAFQAQFEIGDVSTILAMVREGLGISIVPRMSLPNELQGIAVLHLEPPAYRQLALGVLSLASVSPAVAAFMQQAQRTVEGEAKIKPTLT